MTHVLIIADIEGSSGCFDYEASAFLTDSWAGACLEMTRDVDAVARALFDAGATQVTVKDFHRTGYNLLPEFMDPRVELVPGYRRGPIPGIGTIQKAHVLMGIGMHAASGTQGFLAHTFTSRIQSLSVNGRTMPEIAFFSASVAPFGIRPIFFSGCPEACRQARSWIPGIRTYAIDKTSSRFDPGSWRRGLARAAAASLADGSTEVFRPKGPFRAEVRMRDGEMEAVRLAQRWGLEHDKNRIRIEAADIHGLYMALIRLCYLTPAVERVLPLSLWLWNLWGKIGLTWVRWKLRRTNRRLGGWEAGRYRP